MVTSVYVGVGVGVGVCVCMLCGHVHERAGVYDAVCVVQVCPTHSTCLLRV